MQVNLVKVHKYLDVKLDYTRVVQVNITMLEYIDEIIDDFDKSDPTGGGTKSSAVSATLFKVD